MGRSILAVFGGYLAMAFAVGILFAIWFRESGTEPSQGFMVFSLGYGFVFAVVGGYVTARIARRSEMKHVLALAAFSVFMWLISMMVGAEKEPDWYRVATLILTVPAILLGGHLMARQVMEVKGQ